MKPLARIPLAAAAALVGVTSAAHATAPEADRHPAGLSEPIVRIKFNERVGPRTPTRIEWVRVYAAGAGSRLSEVRATFTAKVTW